MKQSMSLGPVLGVFLLLALPAIADEDKDRDREQPFIFVDSGRCPFGHCVTRELDTPAGRQMVIETFSMSIIAADDAAVGTFTLRQVAGEGTNFLHLAPATGPNRIPHVTGASDFVVSQQVRVYPDPSLPVILFGETEDEQATFIATISGRFVSLDSHALTLGSVSP
jgi:hypothetical protein